MNILTNVANILKNIKYDVINITMIIEKRTFVLLYFFSIYFQKAPTCLYITIF